MTRKAMTHEQPNGAWWRTTWVVVGLCVWACSSLAWGGPSVTVSAPSKKGATFDFSIEDGGEPDVVEFVDGSCDGEAVPVKGDYYSSKEDGKYYYIASERVFGLKLRIGYAEEEEKGEEGEDWGEWEDMDDWLEENKKNGEKVKGPVCDVNSEKFHKSKNEESVDHKTRFPVKNEEQCLNLIEKYNNKEKSDFTYICSDQLDGDATEFVGDQSPVIQWREQ